MDNYKNFADDATMREKLGAAYDELGARERFELKEIDLYVRLSDTLGDSAKLEKAVADYLKGSGKSLSELGKVDELIIKYGSNINLQGTAPVKAANSLMEAAANSTKVQKVLNGIKTGGKVAGDVLIVAACAITVVDTVNRANKAIDEGNYGEAAGIVTGSCANMAITFIAGEALAGEFAAYGAGVGFMVGGPVGAAIGGLVGGLAGFGFAMFTGWAVENACTELGKVWDYFFGDASSAVRYVADPLVIDFDGDGFETLSVDNGVYFDEDAKGLLEKTAWVGADDALLAIDINGNGIIDDGTELFGTSRKLSNGSLARSGFEALSNLDTNKDGIIDENDEAFGKLLIWQDKNSNGISEDDELISFDKLNIASISLTTTDENGINTATVTYKDGHSVNIGEFDFEAQYYNTKEKELVEISEEISKLPDIKAMGDVTSLHTLMQMDESGILKGYVEEFISAESNDEKKAALTKILYNITGADYVAVNSRGSNFDAQKLTVIEKILGKDFVGTAGSNPVNTASTILQNLYNDIFDTYFCMLEIQSGFGEYGQLVFVETFEDGTNQIRTELFDTVMKQKSQEGEDVADIVGKMGLCIKIFNSNNPENLDNYISNYYSDPAAMKSIAEYCMSDKLYGSEGGEYLYGTNDNSGIWAGAGNDVVYGYDGNDILYGEAGNDTLYGGNGNDVIVGGAGADYMEGNGGADTYIRTRGEGNDTICNGDTSAERVKDKLIMHGVNKSDVEILRSGNNLLIKDKVGEETITVSNAYWYGDGRYYLENIEFDDGVMGKEELAALATVRTGSDAGETISGYAGSYNYSVNETFYAGAGNDVIYGNDGNDTIYGEDGNDSLYGGNGNDILVGGSGNDYLNGGSGVDIYIHRRGDGNDVICNGDTSPERSSDKLVLIGVKENEVELSRNGNNLLITDTVGKETITIADAYWYGDGRYHLDNLEFDDSTAVINYADLTMDVTYFEVEPEEVILEEEIVDATDIVTDTLSDTEVELAGAVASIDISETDGGEEVVGAEIISVSNDDITKMTDLLIQEMSGDIVGNVSDSIVTSNVSIDDSNVQLWTE